MKLKSNLMILCASLMMATPLYAGDLVIELKGIRSSEGQVLGGIHQKFPDIKFPDAKGSIASFKARAREGTIIVVFKDMPEGDYALTAFHDENNSGKIDRNALGIPTEGYAFSNDAMGFMGPPSFEDTAVTVGEEDATASANMKY